MIRRTGEYAASRVDLMLFTRGRYIRCYEGLEYVWQIVLVKFDDNLSGSDRLKLN